MANPAAPDLADRVQDREATQQAGTSVEKKQKTVFDLIRDQQGGFARALPSMISPERFVRVAVSLVRNNPKLANCDPMSLLGALMLSAQLGLEPSGPGDPRGHAYLVPYGRECTFIIGYKGYMDLARRSGEIASIEAEAVFEGDEFSWELGLHRDLVHRPTATVRTDYERLTHVYAVAWLKDPDAKPIFVVLTKEQVETFKKRSKSAKGPWSTDPIPMAVKTGVRRLATWLPMSVEIQRALGSDERVVDRIDVSADDFIDVQGDEISAERSDDVAEFDCDACEGTGAVVENDQTVKCSKCNGSGKAAPTQPAQSKGAKK